MPPLKALLFFASSIGFALFASPAAAATDYYLTARFPEGGDVTAQFVESATIRARPSGLLVVDITSVYASARTANVFTYEIDCNLHAWRIIYRIAYRVDELTTPLRILEPPSGLTPVVEQDPERKTMDFVCKWPKGTAGVRKIVGSNAIALSKRIAPTIQPAVKGPRRLY